MRRILSGLLVASSSALGSQERVIDANDTLSVATMWLACNNPAIESADSTLPSRWKLRTFCRSIHVPADFRRPTGSQLATMRSALKAIPTVDSVRKYANWEGVAVNAIAAPLTELSADLGLIFQLDSADLPTDVRERVVEFGKKLREHLREHTADTVVLMAATDATGNYDTNRSLAQRRVETIRTILAQQGVPIERVKTVLCPTVAVRLTDAKAKAAAMGSSLEAEGERCKKLGVDQIVAVSGDTGAAPNTGLRSAAIFGPKEAIRIRTASSADTDMRETPKRVGSMLTAGNLSVAVVDAVIERVRADIEAGLLDRAVDRLCGLSLMQRSTERKVSATVQELIPQSCALKEQFTLYKQGLPALRTALRSDLRAAPVNLTVMMIRDGGASATARVASELATLAYALETLNRSPGDVWEILAGFQGWIDAFPNRATLFSQARIPKALQAMAGFAALLLEAQAGAALSELDVRAATAERLEYTLKTYVVLAADSQAAPRWKPQAWLSNRSSFNFEPLYARVQRIAESALQLQSFLDSGAITDAQSIRLVATVLVDAIAAQLAATDTVILQRVTGIVESAAELHLAAIQGDRREMMLRLLRIADPTSLARATIDSLAGESTNTSAMVTMDLPPQWRRVMSFTVDLAEAQDSPEVTSAVRRFLQEGEGYQGKRTRAEENATLCYVRFTRRKGKLPQILDRQRPARCYVAVNAYLSYVGAFQFQAKDVEDGFQGAPYLPVGIEIGKRPKYDANSVLKPAASAALYLQIADLGQLGAARIKEPGSQAPEATYRQFFSPGVHYVHSWQSTMLAWGIGAVYAREVARINDDRRNAWRIQLMLLGFDVPLFP